MRNYRRYSLRRLPRAPALRILLLLFLLWDSLYCISLYIHQAAALNAPPPPHNTKRIYIAAQHWNDARLLRNHWNNALVALVQELGTENVYVSIYESGSYDDSKDALRELDAALDSLQVRKSIVLSETSHADEVASQRSEHGWIQTSDGETLMRRIPFLATVRNYVFEPLEKLAEEDERFDLILFLNDVVFTPEDVLRLLDTNGGEYAAACSIDFSKPPYFYDTFALRDSSGHEAVMQTWPYFGSYLSRYAAERLLPVPVASCWNGMVAMPIKPFLGKDPLRFRGVPDSLAASHVEASECCLIHADNRLSTTKGIFLNPNVKVGYNGSSYDAVHSPDVVMSPIHIFVAVWQNRILRWLTSPVFKEWAVRKRVKRWAEVTGEEERGEFCLIDEMQILYERGWKHM
ncbi:hypothetical protein EJ02DRAFT_347580 [Clathrospora elynae]|uniref:Polysaccharide export protein n=1 Tax=Clathrospora elynae TaxID=706981 RepID=A0A6A5SSF8_9PLEO|nr:hypothetical protein EJ02DRAFT_347580 [Clathrospora elynae]